MKSHASKQTRIAQNKGLPRLLQDKVIVLLRAKPGRFRAQFAAHAEMDPNPIPTRKLEEHLLAPSARAQIPASRYVFHDLPRIAPAKNPLPGMELHRQNLLAEAGVPLLAKKFHLGQFGHQAK
jgi:hypothetical protein